MTDLTDLIRKHLSWYPLMELRDIYKLIYQGVLGPEHMIASPEDFARALEEEFEHLRADPSERLTEPVREQVLLRLNLRAYKSITQDVDRLAHVCLETAAEKWGEPADLVDAWEAFVGEVKKSGFPLFTGQQAEGFTAWLKELNYPAMHHSKAYRELYQPAYRLVSFRLFQQSGLEHVN